MTKAEYILRGRLYEERFRRIAAALGKEHTITKMLGPLAWGRHDWELGPHPLLPQAIRCLGALEGYFAAINMWARDNDRVSQGMIVKIWNEARP
jgi:hypothetical protein